MGTCCAGQWPPRREVSALTLFFRSTCVCVHDQTGSSLCLSTQENFNLPADLCDGTTANLQSYSTTCRSPPILKTLTSKCTFSTCCISDSNLLLLGLLSLRRYRMLIGRMSQTWAAQCSWILILVRDPYYDWTVLLLTEMLIMMSRQRESRWKLHSNS